MIIDHSIEMYVSETWTWAYTDCAGAEVKKTKRLPSSINTWSGAHACRHISMSCTISLFALYGLNAAVCQSLWGYTLSLHSLVVLRMYVSHTHFTPINTVAPFGFLSISDPGSSLLSVCLCLRHVRHVMRGICSGQALGRNTADPTGCGHANYTHVSLWVWFV